MIKLLRNICQLTDTTQAPLQPILPAAVFQSQRLSYKYSLAAFMFFGIQGLVSLGGALEMVFLDIPSPIPYTVGRSFHLNISVLWMLVGMTGGIYYFFSQEAEREIYSAKLINISFWFLILTLISILGSLLLGFNDGREYLEAVQPLKLAVLIGCLALFYNLLRTYMSCGVPKTRGTLVGIISGCLSLIIFYLPNIMSYAHPTIEEIFKFWYIHLWEEMSMELIGVGLMSALLIVATGVKRESLEKLIYLDLIMIAAAGILATGHHYYWIGVPGIWIWIGGIFSAIQAIPVLLLVFSLTKTSDTERFSQLSLREKITIALVASSVFNHIFGASMLGLIMSYPNINRYTHGTYIVSAHSHLALFGVFGFLVLAVCFYIFFTGFKLNHRDYRLCWLAILALNGGLIIMSIALLAAGWLQAYLLNIAGLAIIEVNETVRPYLIARVVGGLVFSFGSSLFAWVIAKNAWCHRDVFFEDGAQSDNRPIQKLQQIQLSIRNLMGSLKEIEVLLGEVKYLSKMLAVIKKMKEKKKKE
ncbi:MAG: nitric-oxide reductase [Veillonellaceae bacterium]|jgi:nitric oxide reductase subunit B|nr:nitric-oxide reductase [Veillonellaceae bacterium]